MTNHDLIKTTDLIKEICEKMLHISIFEVIRLKSALTNLVYKVVTPCGDYIYKEYRNDPEIELKVLSKYNAGNILYECREFRIEKFIDHKPFDYRKDSFKIYQALRRLNEVEIELWDFTEMLESLMKDVLNERNQGILMKLFERIKQIPVLNDVKKLCHNDLQPGNGLLTDDEFILIDFEYCSKNNPLFDYANIFCEMAVCYESGIFIQERMPSEEIKREILTHLSKEEVEKNLVETNQLICCSHFLWFLWAVKSGTRYGNEVFDYSKFAVSRLRGLEFEGYLDCEEVRTLTLNDCN